MTARTRVAALLVPLLSTPLLGVVGAPAASAEGLPPDLLPSFGAETAVYNALRREPDVPLTGELALSLVRLPNGDSEDVRAAVARVEPRAEAEWYGVGSTTDVGALAQAVLLAQAAGSDPRSFGGVDLVQRLEATVSTTGPSAGRADGGAQPDVEDQALAVEALEEVGSVRAAQARAYLLAQQCPAGWFARDLPAAGAVTQTCDPATSTPDVPATARAVLAVDGAADAAAAQEAAEVWLVGVQGVEGGFTRTGAEGETDSASTALAGHALGASGRTTAAAEASVWLRTAQAAVGAGPCGYRGATGLSLGFVAPDRDAFETGVRAGLTAAQQRAWLRITALAVPALRFVPEDDGRTFRLLVPEGIQRPGSTVDVSVAGLPARIGFCLYLAQAGEIVLGRADDDGRATVPVKLPSNRTSIRIQTWLADAPFGESESVRLRGRARLDVTVRDRTVAPGGRQRVVVTGLARREPTSVRYNGRTVASGASSAKGVFIARFAVGERARRVSVVVRGAYPDRRGRAFFTVGR